MSAAKGWGLRSHVQIFGGGFVCCYAGEVLDDLAADQRGPSPASRSSELCPNVQYLGITSNLGITPKVQISHIFPEAKGYFLSCTRKSMSCTRKRSVRERAVFVITIRTTSVNIASILVMFERSVLIQKQNSSHHCAKM